MTTHGVKCPDCGSTNITSCHGGSRLNPSPWEKENIRYICTDCTCEFGTPKSDAYPHCPECHNPLTIRGRKGGIKRICTNPDCSVIKVKGEQ